MDNFAECGCLTYRLISAATTNGNNVKAAKGRVMGISISNINAAAKFLKLYNKATAPTVGTDTPTHTFLIPAGTSAQLTLNIPANGLFFDTGIGVGITGAVADNDTTAVAANEHVLHVYYL